MVAKPPQGGLWTGSPQASRGLFLGLGPLFLFAVLNLIRPCPFLASLNGFTSLYVRLLLILCVTGYCEIFILFRNHYKLGYDHYGQRIIGDLVLGRSCGFSLNLEGVAGLATANDRRCYPQDRDFVTYGNPAGLCDYPGALPRGWGQ